MIELRELPASALAELATARADAITRALTNSNDMAIHTSPSILSVWEISHRWQGVDPDESDPQKLPRPVRERIRQLFRLPPKSVPFTEVQEGG